MNKVQKLSDQTAIGLSLLCVAHCLILPVLLILLPTLFGIAALNDEVFHKWLIYSVCPISLVALFIGYLHHRVINVFATALIGLGVLIFAAFFGHDLVSEYAEIILTLIGSGIIVYSHLRNYQLRNKSPLYAS